MRQPFCATFLPTCLVPRETCVLKLLVLLCRLHVSELVQTSERLECNAAVRFFHEWAFFDSVDHSISFLSYSCFPACHTDDVPSWCLSSPTYPHVMVFQFPSRYLSNWPSLAASSLSCLPISFLVLVKRSHSLSCPMFDPLPHSLAIYVYMANERTYMYIYVL